jgi:hypothetical protein
MCLDVHSETLIPILVVNLLLDVGKCGHARPASVGDYHVQSTHCVDRLFNEILHGWF